MFKVIFYMFSHEGGNIIESVVVSRTEFYYSADPAVLLSGFYEIFKQNFALIVVMISSTLGNIRLKK